MGLFCHFFSKNCPKAEKGKGQIKQIFNPVFPKAKKKFFRFFVMVALFAVIGYFGFYLTPTLMAATSGPNNPATAVDDSSTGTIAWTNPGNVVSSNNSYATASLDDNEISHYLKATNFSFAIPAGATINGITAEIEKNHLTHLEFKITE